MNYLHRKIKAGEQVVVNFGEFMKLMPIEMRVFVCNGIGSGCDPNSNGRGIFGHWLDDPTKNTERINGDMIDSAKTKEWQEQHS